MTLETLSVTASVLFGVAIFAATRNLAGVRPLPRPELGHRGLMRTRALDRAGFAAIEPSLRFLAALASHLPCHRTRARLETAIERAGHALGLCADECMALCALLAALAAGFFAALGFGIAAVAIAACAGMLAPLAELYEHGRARRRQIARRLPAAIDLMALCMGAGLDFTSALEMVARELGGTSDALRSELRRLLQELELGRTRARALAELADRVPTPAVRDFAHAVIQAEQRGNPLAQVLQVQARVLRLRRSVAAEEAAARASVLFLLPLLLLLAAVLLLLFGPFIVNGSGV